MATANQSLNDALRLTFRLLVVGVAGLAVVYVFSGVRAIQPNERGIALVFGRPDDTDLQPGPVFAPPAPIGQVIAVDVGPQQTFTLPGESGELVRGRNLDRDFMPQAPPGKENQPFNDFAPNNMLNPERDDSLITGDLNLAHGRWRLTFTRRDHEAWARSVLPEAEGRMLRSITRRAIIRAVAETPLEEYLKQSRGVTELPERARALANAALREIDSGLEITDLRLEDRKPPRFLSDRFDAVQSAEAEASTRREVAEKERETQLTQTAGQNWRIVTEEIRRYERELDLGQKDEASATLARIHALMLGEPVEVNGQTLTGVIGGEVSQLLAGARADRQAVVQRAKADYERFVAAIEQYRANPALTVQRLWADAYGVVSAFPLREVHLLPPVEVLIIKANTDPGIRDAILEQQNQRKAAAADRRRQEAFRNAQLELRSGQASEER